MKTENRSKWRVATMAYCTGSTKKKARIRLRWSLRRVCCRVMNSRSARKEKRPKNRVAPIGPEIQASQNRMVPTQTARRSRRKRWAAGLCESWAGRSECKNAPSVTSTTRPNRITNSSATCSSTPSWRRLPNLIASCRPWPQGQHCRPGAIEEGALVLFDTELQRRAESHRTQDRHRHHLALGHHTLHVVDPGRDQLHLRELLCQVVQAALERLWIALAAACALGEDHHRIALFERVGQ